MADATTSPTVAGSVPAAAAAPQKLDDLMLAMDVVDTLRHQETLAAKELDDDARKAELIGRLKKIYAAQGIEVPERIVEEGVKALEESRFSYTPTPPGLSRTLALVWVDRKRWGLGLGVLVLALVVGVGGYRYVVVGGRERAAEALRVEIAETLPAALDKASRAALDEAKVPSAQARAEDLTGGGRAALARGDVAAAKTAIGDLSALTATLRETWQVRIVTRPGERSGVWRAPAKSAAHNYYLIVEAIGPDGRPMERSILNEENQKTKTVTIWGQRVPKATFDRVAADQQDDGIIQMNRLGEKRRGEFDVRWALPVETGTITEW